MSGLYFDEQDVGGHVWIEVKVDNKTYAPFEPQTGNFAGTNYIPVGDYIHYEDTSAFSYSAGNLLEVFNALNNIKITRQK